jgi:hypothetical protein
MRFALTPDQAPIHVFLFEFGLWMLEKKPPTPPKGGRVNIDHVDMRVSVDDGWFSSSIVFLSKLAQTRYFYGSKNNNFFKELV